jgi:hypothetical protein
VAQQTQYLPLLQGLPSQIRTGPAYHYTSASGLLGITTELRIWATHSQYLNDRHEYHHARKLALTEIESRLAGSLEYIGTRLEFLKEMRSVLEAPLLPYFNVCVVSFSGEFDSLPQWRAYAGKGGYAIGFERRTLTRLATESGWQVVNCIYDREEQKILIARMIEEVIKLSEAGGAPALEGLANSSPIARSTIAVFNQYAPILKSQYFREENEVRLISPCLKCTDEGFCFREGKSQIVPFFKFPLAASPKDLPFLEVIVGPYPDEGPAMSSVKSLLRSKTDKFIVVRSSDIPFKDW